MRSLCEKRWINPWIKKLIGSKKMKMIIGGEVFILQNGLKGDKLKIKNI